MKPLLLRLLAFYRWFLSPLLHTLMPGGCKFEPSCSRYAAEAIEIHGAARGAMLALHRLMRCHPLTRGGFDPVPLAAGRPRAESVPAAFPETLHDPLP